AEPAYVQQALSALLEETAASPEPGVFAWRGSVRWQRYLRPINSTSSPPSADRLRNGGTYLLTGGYGGISGVIGEWLAREFDARLILVARTPIPARPAWDDWLASHAQDDSISQAIRRIRDLEALGALVLPIAADVTVQEQVADAVRLARETFGDINGEFHTAGTLRDSLIQLKGQKDVEEVFSAKVYGTQVLDQVFEDSDLDFMVLFSSTSAFIAPQGQIDYVAANSFINAFADSRSDQRPYPVTAVNWGIWRDVGMARQPAAARQSGPEQPLDVEARHGTEVALIGTTFDAHLVLRESTKHVHLLSGTLSSTHDWMVDEHRLATGEALLPGTGYAELIRAALQEIGVVEPWKLRNLSFLAPLFVPDGAPRQIRIRLEGNAALWQVAVYAQAAHPDGPDRWAQCASARVDTRDVSEPAGFDADSVRQRCTAAHEKAGGSGALRTRQENHLRFGPRWQTLRQVDLGAGEAIAQLALPATQAADLTAHPLHPALLDIATGYAMDLIPGYSDQGGTSLWAPLSYSELVFYRPLVADLQSWVRLADSPAGEHGTAAFDVTIADTAGNVLVQVRQLTLRR
ncbi:MAG: SDR family oxidoreductase, partial [Pseudomonadales bacterium]